MRHSLAADKKKLESCVEKYNKLCNAVEDLGEVTYLIIYYHKTLLCNYHMNFMLQ